MGVCVGVSVGDGVSVGGRISVSVGMEVKVSVEEMLVDVETGLVKGETGTPPVLPGEQANVVNIRMMGKMYFEFFIA